MIEELENDKHTNKENIESNTTHDELNTKYLFTWKSNVDDNLKANHNRKIYPLKNNNSTSSSSSSHYYNYSLENYNNIATANDNMDYEWKNETDALWRNMKTNESTFSKNKIENDELECNVPCNDDRYMSSKLDEKIVHNKPFVAISIDDNEFSDHNKTLLINNCQTNRHSNKATINKTPIQKNQTLTKQEEEFDVALVLQPNEVYSYWSNILDFTLDEDYPNTNNMEIITTTSSSIKKRVSSTVRSLFDRAIERLTPPKKESIPAIQTTKEVVSPNLEEIFPSQKIPRGIAARNNGMQHFLQALSNGIVVKKFTCNNYIHVKLFSVDNGDTIQYEYINSDDAYVAFKEQSMRYNHSSSTTITSNSTSNTTKMIIPDYIAAQNPTKLSKKIHDTYKKVYNYYMYTGTIHTKDIALIHPAQHIDPTNEVGTKTLRKLTSKGLYYNPQKTFSILFNKSSDDDLQNYTSIDIEANTIGEYWLLFRGFLLLHRDASVGRFSVDRCKGFSSYYNTTLYEKEKHKLDDKEIIYKNNEMIVSDLITNPPPPDYFLGFYTPGTQIWNRLKQIGNLQTKRYYNFNTNIVMIKLRCPTSKLQDIAEYCKFKLPTRYEDVVYFTEYVHGKDYVISSENELFRSSDRQRIIDFIIKSRIRDNGCELQTSLNNTTGLGKYIHMVVPLHKQPILDGLYDKWILFWNKENFKGEGILYRFFIGAFRQPLDDIQQYYGESIALYFAWIQHITFHLTYLSLFGIIVCITQFYTKNGYSYDHPILFYYSNFIILWSFVVLITWKRYSNTLTHKWGTLNYESNIYEDNEITRPQYRGVYRKCEDDWVIYYPSWKRWIMKYCVSIPLCMLFTAFTLFVILTVNANRDMLISRYYSSTVSMNDISALALLQENAPTTSFHITLTKTQLQDPIFWILTLGIPTILALCLPLLNFLLMKIAIFLNDIENHRTESSYRNHLIVKVFAFRFVCYFASLYFYCYMAAFDGMGVLRVAATLFVFLTVGHWWNSCVQIYIPHLIYKWKLRRRKKNLSNAYSNLQNLDDKKTQNQKILLHQASNETWEQTMLPIYNSFHDYVVLIMNFGYITCFSTILPITPFIVLINNLFTLRLDAYKLCRGRQRPLATKAGGLGVWEHCLHIVTIIAVFTNCGLIAFTTTQLNGFVGDNNKGSDGASNATNLSIFLFIVGWEHVMLFIKYLLNAVISKIPKSVLDDLKRERNAIRKLRNSNKSKDYSQKQLDCGAVDDTTITTNNTNIVIINTTQQCSKEPNTIHRKDSLFDANETNNNTDNHDSFISPVVSQQQRNRSSLKRRGQCTRSCSKSPIKPNYLRL